MDRHALPRDLNQGGTTPHECRSVDRPLNLDILQPSYLNGCPYMKSRPAPSAATFGAFGGNCAAPVPGAQLSRDAGVRLVLIKASLHNLRRSFSHPAGPITATGAEGAIPPAKRRQTARFRAGYGSLRQRRTVRSKTNSLKTLVRCPPQRKQRFS
jgi:hypothetical protein